jgi:hypothetical protein
MRMMTTAAVAAVGTVEMLEEFDGVLSSVGGLKYRVFVRFLALVPGENKLGVLPAILNFILRNE